MVLSGCYYPDGSRPGCWRIDESYMKQLVDLVTFVGSTAFATAVLRNTAVYTGPYRLDTPDLNNFISQPTAVTVRNANTHAGAGNDAAKVAYISPIFNGLRFGASWLNNNSNDNNLANVGGTAGTSVQSYDIGVQYSAKNFRLDVAHGKHW